MRIKLINPAQLDVEGRPVKFNREFSAGLTLPYVAALFPGQHDISIVEESVETIDFSEPVDLVGLTAITCRAPRAYWIAAQYRKKGVPVVMGGFHATALPEEALQHCDAVVQGEAEGVLEQVVEDARAGKLNGIYAGKVPPDLHKLPVPRYDLLNLKNFFVPLYPVQITRGCPYHCDFCSVTSLFGSRHRKRPIEDVIRDIRAAGPYLNIVDDNLTVDRQYALELFRAIQPLNKPWIGQADLPAAADEELMRAAAEAGCRALYLGVETLDKRSLLSSHKTPNLNTSVEEALRQLKRRHIEAFVSMIIGFDRDTAETAQEIIHFCRHMRVPALFLYILTPMPGSPLFQRLTAKKVVLKKGWHLYDGMHAVCNTPSLKAAELEALYMQIQQRVYSLPSIIRRTALPPHIIMLMFNLCIAHNIRSRFHPWMGNDRWDRLLDFIPRAGKPLMHPRVRKFSRLLRALENRVFR